MTTAPMLAFPEPGLPLCSFFPIVSGSQLIVLHGDCVNSDCVAAVKLAHEWPGVYILQPWPRYTMRVRNMEHYQHVSTKLARNAADARHHR